MSKVAGPGSGGGGVRASFAALTIPWRRDQSVEWLPSEPYGSDALYEERSPDGGDYRESWAGFRSAIRSRARFFNAYAEELLSGIFGDLTSHKASDAKPLMREIGPRDERLSIWRARKAQSIEELMTILKTPAREIGPPPSRLAKGGRINAPGIPVFYGALESE